MKLLEERENIKKILDKKINIYSFEFFRIMSLYKIAMDKVVERIQGYDKSYKYDIDYSIVYNFENRIKDANEILEKLKKKDLEPTYRNMIENINDIAGVRIVCPVKEDISSVRDYISKIDRIRVLNEKDYVTMPKDDGYMSYHMILLVPTQYRGNEIGIKVEIQIRSLAMDTWSNTEYNISYKPDFPEKYEELELKLDTLTRKLDSINNKLEFLSK